MKNQLKPWVKKDGDTFSDQELLEVTKNWSGEDWEEYLANTVEKPLLETLPDQSEFIENCVSNYSQAYQDMLAKNDCPNLQSAVRAILLNLTIREQRVIYELFWQEKSLRTVAREMGIGKKAVEIYKSRALSKMGCLFLDQLSPKPKSLNGSRGVSSRFRGQKPIGKEKVSENQVVGA
jgi:DNA-directed RNA polymerase specialized sigma subunit